jgi:hypothetical protein
MATITTILASDIIASSRVTLNTNFANLNTDKVDINSTYADPAWITSLAGSKITGNIGGNAATATALATARTIAGISFDGTANIAIPSTGLSDSSDIVRGAPSVASGQVLYGTGAGVAGSEANLFWDAANDRLGVGTNTPADLAQFQSASGAQARLTIVAGATAQSPGLQLGWPGNTNAGIIRVDLAGANGGDLSIWSKATGSSVSEKMRVFGSGNVAIGTTTDDGTNRLQVAGSVAATVTSAVSSQDGATSLRLATSLVGTAVAGTAGSRITFAQRWQSGDVGIIRVGAINGWKTANDGAFGGGIQLLHQPNSAVDMSVTLSTFQTGNVAIGTTTDGNFRLDIAASGSSGTLRAYDQTPTTGTTQLIVRAGAGQSTTNLTTWQNAAGTALAGITGAGSFFTGNNANATGDSLIDANGLRFGSTVLVRWSNNLPVNAADISLSRAGVNIGQFGDGSANSNGLLYLKGVRPVGSTVANLPTASGNTGMLATVTDATVTTIGTTVAGGGGNTVLVWSNGTNWRIYAN